MKKFLKTFVIVFSIVFVLFVGGIIAILYRLPSAASIGQRLKPSNIKSTLKNMDAPKTAPIPLPEKPNDTSEAVVTTPPPAVTATNDKPSEVNIDQDLIAEMLDTTKPLADVCRELGNVTKSHLNGYSFKEFGQAYRDSVLKDDKDPIIQSMKPTLKFMFTRTALKDVLMEAQAAEARGETDDLISKAQFYGKMITAYRDILSQREHLESIMDRSYHLMMMAKVIAKKPQLLSDARLGTYCQDIQDAINFDSPSQFSIERSEFDQFLGYTGVNPKDIGYDPNYRTKLDISFKNRSLKAEGGWIDTVLKPSAEEVEALAPEQQ